MSAIESKEAFSAKPELVGKLRSGTVQRKRRWSGDTHTEFGGTCDEDATDKIMTEAADRIEALEAALKTISNMCPATCEMTLAHIMADVADAALKPSRD